MKLRVVFVFFNDTATTEIYTLSLHDALPIFWLAGFLTKVPYYWGLDKISRAHFNRAFYKNYAGWKPSRAKHLGLESFPGFTLSRIYPGALSCLRKHKQMGHRDRKSVV